MDQRKQLIAKFNLRYCPDVPVHNEVYRELASCTPGRMGPVAMQARQYAKAFQQ